VIRLKSLVYDDMSDDDTVERVRQEMAPSSASTFGEKAGLHRQSNRGLQAEAILVFSLDDDAYFADRYIRKRGRCALSSIRVSRRHPYIEPLSRRSLVQRS